MADLYLASDLLWSERQDEIAVCMSSRGFDYLPVPFVDGSKVAESGVLDVSEAGWAAEFGFGISTLLFDAGVLGRTDLAFAQPIVDNDPNIAATARMGQAEGDAWMAAMYGHLPDPSGLSTLDPESLDVALAELQLDADDAVMASCSGRTIEGTRASTEFAAQYRRQIEEIMEAAQSHPNVVNARDSVLTCMRDRGFPRTAEEYILEFEGRSRVILAEFLGELEEQIALTNPDITELEYRDLVDRGGLQPSIGIMSRLEELQDAEREAALASVDCGGGSRLDDLVRDTRLEIELRRIGDGVFG